MSSTNNNPAIEYKSAGAIVNDFMSKNSRSNMELSRKLGMHTNNVNKFKDRVSMQSKLLWELSVIYQHNFLADIALRLPANYTGALQEAMAAKDREIAATQNELAAMTKERDIYRDLLKR